MEARKAFRHVREQDEQKHLYFDDTHLTRTVSTVVRAGLKGRRQWVILRENIFHPQSGGQPADRGWVAGVEVKPVHMVDNGTWVAVEATEGLTLPARLGDQVETAIDEEFLIGDFSVDECGGTHVAHLSELDGVVVRSAKVKKGRLKVGYQASYEKRSDG